MRGPHRLSSRGAQAQRRNEVLRRSTQARCACSPFADIAIAALGADGKPFVMGRVGAAHAEAIDARPTAPDDPHSVGRKGSHRWRAGRQQWGGWRRRWADVVCVRNPAACLPRGRAIRLIAEDGANAARRTASRQKPTALTSTPPTSC